MLIGRSLYEISNNCSSPKRIHLVHNFPLLFLTMAFFCVGHCWEHIEPTKILVDKICLCRRVGNEVLNPIQFRSRYLDKMQEIGTNYECNGSKSRNGKISAIYTCKIVDPWTCFLLDLTQYLSFAQLATLECSQLQKNSSHLYLRLDDIMAVWKWIEDINDCPSGNLGINWSA